jgi:hypothetical protein
MQRRCHGARARYLGHNMRLEEMLWIVVPVLVDQV